MSLSSLRSKVLGFWAVRLVLVLLALWLSILMRDIVVGILAGVLRLGANQPPLWLGRPCTPETMTVVGSVFGIAGFLITVGLGYGVYAWYVRRIERREPTEIALKGAAAPFGIGTIMGIGIVLSAVAVIGLAGGVSIVPSGQWRFAVTALAGGATAAFMEELVLRGIVLRILEHWMGTWMALATSAALFGVIHLTNDGATWTSTLTIALTGGLILGLAYILTRNVWLAVGMHFGVNAAQGGLLGLPVSGQETPGVFATEVSGPNFLTGGAFGVESSVTVLAVGLVLAFVLLGRVRRHGQIVPPPWRRGVVPTAKPSAEGP